ncbi:MAG: aldehyde dehydrogenase family protein [Myxococcota bacterium]|nr:aldehyde dehydrogenase family protein [Myxococcota bacterium]
MSSPDFATVAPRGSSTPTAQVHALVARLAARKHAWPHVSTRERAALLERCIPHTLDIAREWVEAACAAKGIDPESSRAGEEWLGGPMTTVRNLRLLAEAMRADGQPTIPSVTKRPDGQLVAQVFPQSFLDGVMFTGISAEVWIEPGKPATQGAIYRAKKSRPPGDRDGKLALVLGAGNVASIGPMDALYKLFVEDEVVLVKTNPVNAYLQPFWEEAFRPLLDAGYFAVVRGGADVGALLCEHPEVDTIHITGSDRTHDAIVWGSTRAEQEKNKAAGTPKMKKPITSELGAVTPCMVVPGHWTEADLAFQARHIAGMVANNASFNCNACKVVVTAKGWPERQRFLDLVHEALERTPPRKAYYPGAQERYQGFLDAYPNAKPLSERTRDVVPWTMLPDVGADGSEYALCNEAFCGVLADVALDESSPGGFLDAMTEFANDQCWGTLSCMMLVDDKTQREHAASLDRALASLRYGGIGVNVWAGLVYGLVTPTWGAYPGHPLEDVRSGRGVVHNALLIDHPQKSIVRAPFRMRPTPVWFPDHRTLRPLAELVTAFEGHPSMLKLPKIVATAMRG